MNENYKDVIDKIYIEYVLPILDEQYNYSRNISEVTGWSQDELLDNFRERSSVLLAEIFKCPKISIPQDRVSHWKRRQSTILAKYENFVDFLETVSAQHSCDKKKFVVDMYTYALDKISTIWVPLPKNITI